MVPEVFIIKLMVKKIIPPSLFFGSFLWLLISFLAMFGFNDPGSYEPLWLVGFVRIITWPFSIPVTLLRIFGQSISVIGIPLGIFFPFLVGIILNYFFNSYHQGRYGDRFRKIYLLSPIILFIILMIVAGTYYGLGLDKSYYRSKYPHLSQ